MNDLKKLSDLKNLSEEYADIDIEMKKLETKKLSLRAKIIALYIDKTTFKDTFISVSMRTVYDEKASLKAWTDAGHTIEMKYIPKQVIPEQTVPEKIIDAHEVVDSKVMKFKITEAKMEKGKKIHTIKVK